MGLRRRRPRQLGARPRRACPRLPQRIARERLKADHDLSGDQRVLADEMLDQASRLMAHGADKLIAHMGELHIAMKIRSTETIKQANALTQRWNVRFLSPLELDDAHELVVDTRAYLSEVPQQVSATNAQLMEIMMAQDFQDLTGQVIMKMMDVIKDMETQLLRLLIDNAPPEKRQEVSSSPLNGPQIKCGDPDAAENQDQVDDLLASLGF